MYYVAQKSYCPQGSLRAQVVYPLTEEGRRAAVSLQLWCDEAALHWCACWGADWCWLRQLGLVGLTQCCLAQAR